MNKRVSLILLLALVAAAGVSAWDVAYPLYLSPVEVDTMYGSYSFALEQEDSVTLQANTTGTYWVSVSIYDADFNIVASYNGWVHKYGWPYDLANFYLYPGQNYSADITAYSYNEGAEFYLEFALNFNQENLSYFYFDGK